ncbi:MAG TPA: sigma-70 family RNA polymerase sigma factor, partial [Bradyrhizobium sp.]
TVRLSVRQGTEVLVEYAGLTTPANQYSAIEFRDLQRALRSLPAGQRDVVLMICIEGMSYEEVAEILVIPIGTVRSRLSRARDAIRSRMAGELTKSKERASAIPVSVCFRVQRERIDKMRRALEPLSVGTPLVQAMPIHVG